MSVVATSSHCETVPEAGRKLASATVDSSISVKLSGAKRGVPWENSLQLTIGSCSQAARPRLDATAIEKRNGFI